MDRRDFLYTAGTLATAAAVGARPSFAAENTPPNFVVILADDMGYSDPGCFGSDIETPTLDGLARTGARFNTMYSAGRCGPSRGCLMTGMYAQQTGADVMTPGKIANYTHFVPEALKTRGYRSYHAGKWHFKLTAGKDGVGFDRSYLMLDEDRYFTQRNHELDGVRLPPPGPGYYSTTAIADYSIDFLKDHQINHRNEPFFMYTAFHAPHFPLQAPPEDIARYHGRFDVGWDVIRQRRHKKMLEMGLVNCALAPMEPSIFPPWNLPVDQLKKRIGPGEVGRAVKWTDLTPEQQSFHAKKMEIHAAMITRLDTEVEKIVRQLKAMGAYENTLIVILSDNGASAEQIIRGDGEDPAAPMGSAKSFLGIGPGWATAADTPFRLHKSWVHEGGISSPMIVNWPNGISRSERLRTDPCHFIDILPTFADLAGASLHDVEGEGPAFPGKSLAPAIRTAQRVTRDSIYFHHIQNRALRTADWKLVSKGLGGPWELYDMRTDRCERNDLVSVEHARAKEMTAEWERQEQLYQSQRAAAPPTTKTMFPTAPSAKEAEPSAKMPA